MNKEFRGIRIDQDIWEKLYSHYKKNTASIIRGLIKKHLEDLEALEKYRRKA
jgi:predicted CopG family antitoxin